MQTAHLRHTVLAVLCTVLTFSHRANSIDLQASTLSSSFGCPRNGDPFRPTLLAHPTDCSKYISCDWFREHVMHCPTGQHWNHAKKYCDFPTNANCSVEPPTQRPHSICPTNGYELIGFPGVCSKYVQCSRGLVYVMSCPGGLFWSDSEKRCDYAHKSECMSGSSSLRPPDNGEREKKRPHCPHVSDRDTLVSDPADCSKYFQCWNGYAVLRSCPGGLHWNAKRNRCDWPYLANCVKFTTQTPSTEVPEPGTNVSSEPSKPATEETSTEVPIHITTLKPSSEKPSTDKPTVQSSTVPPSPEVPSEPSKSETENPVIETSTNEQSTTESETEAPATKDPVNESSEEPQTEPSEVATTALPETSAPAETSEEPSTEADTNEPATDSPTDPSEESSTEVEPKVPSEEPPKEETETTDDTPIDTSSSDAELVPESSGGGEIPEILKLDLAIDKETNKTGLTLPLLEVASLLERFCPPEADMKPSIRFGDPENCSRYYECADGTPEVRSCPNGKHWNSHSQKCDRPISARCSEKQTADLKDRSLKDCSSVLQNFGNTKVLVSCPNGLYWNQAVQECDFAANVKCRKKGRGVRYNPCPYGDRTHVPYSVRFNDFSDCRRFIQCQNGFAYHLECPAGLRWNKILGHCDWAEYVSCGWRDYKRKNTYRFL